MMGKKALAALTIALAAGTGGSVAAQQPSSQDLTEITFLTNYAFHGRHSPFFVGLEKGFYAEEGFDITIQPATGSGFVITALDGGQADYGMADRKSTRLNSSH